MGLNYTWCSIVLTVLFVSTLQQTLAHNQHQRRYDSGFGTGFDIRFTNSKVKREVIPHPFDCRYYYVVNYRGDLVSLECEKGLVFDSESLECKVPEQAICWSKHRQDVALMPSLAVKKKFDCPHKFGSFPDPDDCSRWFLCLFSREQNRKCSKGELYDRILKKCAEKSTVDCNAEAGKDDESFKCPHSYGEYPYPKDCSKYFLCKQKKSSVKQCKSEKLFDVKNKECRDQEKVDCGSRINPNDDKLTSTAATKILPDEVSDSTQHRVTSESSEQDNSTPKTTKENTKIITSSLEKITTEYITNPSETFVDLNSKDYTTTEAFEERGTGDDVTTRPTDTFPLQTTRDVVIVCSTNLPGAETIEDTQTKTRPNLETNNDVTNDCFELEDLSTTDLVTIESTLDEIVKISTEISSEEPEFKSSTNPTGDDWKISSKPKDICVPGDVTCFTDGSGVIVRCSTANGLFPHPTDKNSFFQCHNFKIHVQKCAGNLVFDPVHRVCNWPKNR